MLEVQFQLHGGVLFFPFPDICPKVITVFEKVKFRRDWVDRKGILKHFLHGVCIAISYRLLCPVK